MHDTATPISTADSTGGAQTLNPTDVAAKLGIDLRSVSVVLALLDGLNGAWRIAYRPKEVADRLGVSERYVYTLFETGELRHIRLSNNGKFLVLATDLADFVNKVRAERAQIGASS